MLEADFRRLNTPSSKSFTQVAFHIGPRDKLETSSHLIPSYIRDGEPLDPAVLTDGEDFEDADYYTSCAVTGNIDQLSSFLVRHALSTDMNDSRPGNFMIDLRSFTRDINLRWLIAVVGVESAQIRRVHDWGSFYIEYGAQGEQMPMYRFCNPEPIRQKLLIPRLQLSRTQKQNLLEEGFQFYQDVVRVDPDVFPYWDRDEKSVSEAFQLAREQELAVKAALLPLGTN